jgi:hypothetical protein
MEWRTVRKNIPPKNTDGEKAAEEGKSHGNSSVKEAPKAKAEAEAEVEAHKSTLIKAGEPEEKNEHTIDTEKVGGQEITT